MLPEQLRGILKSNKTSRLEKVACVRSLRERHDRDSVQLIFEALNNRDPQIKIAALSALSSIDLSEEYDILTSLARNETENTDVRHIALTNLAERYKGACRPVLHDLLRSKNRFVAASAADVLGSVGDKTDASILRECFQEQSNADSRLAFALGLAQLKDTSIFPLLEYECKRYDRNTCVVAAVALYYLDKHKALVAMKEILTKASADIRDSLQTMVSMRCLPRANFSFSEQDLLKWIVSEESS